MCTLHLKRRQVIDLRSFVIKLGRKIDEEDGSELGFECVFEFKKISLSPKYHLIYCLQWNLF